jgi:hypothetical protein
LEAQEQQRDGRADGQRPALGRRARDEAPDEQAGGQGRGQDHAEPEHLEQVGGELGVRGDRELVVRAHLAAPRDGRAGPDLRRKHNLTHEIQGYLRLPVLGRIYAGWWQAHDKGSETLTRTVEFEGVTFNQSTQVDSEVTLDVAYLTYEFAFPTIPVGDLVQVELGVQLGIRALRGEGSISESAGGRSESEDGIIALPTLGAHATVVLFSFVRAEVEVLGLAVSYGDWSAHYLEASAEIVAQPLPWIFGGVGYKVVGLEFRHSGSQKFELDVGVAGLYLTFGVRF